MMEYKALKDIATITMGQSPDSSSYNEEKNGIPFYQGNADFGELYPTARVWCSNPKKIAKENDILISVRAPIGALNYATEECCIGRGLAAITIENDSERNYVFHFLKAQNKELNNKGTGSTFKAISKSVLEEVQVPVISKEKQEISMKLMDVIEQIIRQRKEELQRLDDLIKARFVEMFGDAVDNPMGWEKRQLQGIVTDDCTISYGIVQTGDEQEEGVPVFRPVDIVNKVPKLAELKKTTEEISNKYKRTILKGRELLITVRANIADTCIVGEEFKGCNVGRGIVPIRTQEDIMVLEFLKYLLDSKHLNDDIKSKAKGITLIQLNMEDLREVELIIPPIEKQMAFVEFAKQVNKSKVAVQEALDEAQLLFDSLMQKYFGQRRVNDEFIF